MFRYARLQKEVASQLLGGARRGFMVRQDAKNKFLKYIPYCHQTWLAGKYVLHVNELRFKTGKKYLQTGHVQLQCLITGWYLVGGLEHLDYVSHHIGNVIIPTDFICFRGVAQPPTRYVAVEMPLVRFRPGPGLGTRHDMRYDKSKSLHGYLDPPNTQKNANYY